MGKHIPNGMLTTSNHRFQLVFWILQPLCGKTHVVELQRLQAEANVLQHHLGISAKFREARQLCSELKSERIGLKFGRFRTAVRDI